MNDQAIATAKKAVIKTYDNYWYMIPAFDDDGNEISQEPGCANYGNCQVVKITHAEIDDYFESPYENDSETIGVTVTVDWQWSDEEPEQDVKLLVPVWVEDGEWVYGEIERVD